MTMTNDSDAHPLGSEGAEANGALSLLRGLSFCIQTFGCQMNEYDSERMAELLTRSGMRPVAEIEQADLVLLNTCAVREKPSHKVVSLLGRLRPRQGTRRGAHRQRLAVAGCVAQHQKEELLRQVPWLDLVIGPDAIPRLPELVERAFDGERICDTSFTDRHAYAFPNAQSETVRGRASALVTVMKGCNNGCAYCVVPRTRGREQSRPKAEVLAEVRGMAEAGVREVVLIGQNVNSYDGGCSFAALLSAVSEVTGIERIRFTTSNPHDLGDDLVEAFARLPKLMPSFHLPVQSGSDRVLAQMRRGYTVADYLARIDKLRAARPGIALTTDIIAGFPGETEAEFEETIALCERVRYENVYSFVFSPRAGTSAARHEAEWGIVPHEEKVRRLEKLQAIARDISLSFAQAKVGQAVEVLVEGVSKTRADRLFGRTPESRTVNFEGNARAGELVMVEIASASSNALFGVQRGAGRGHLS
ncbi:MAG: tRNA (N6-isopentenyl adenosine(37)-C2)-methylthiotransferase MiaB [Myxococcales bacterium]|jgi:tRNA-2-methylthio-N6-dimethylallyladenosine synthase|nr:tRNA (N6-isopentenyl adenosine(37)-C2)-methylthiotransferase MiaB [Myxococcales bacterium]